MKIKIEGNLIETTADSQLHVVLSGARGPQGPPGEPSENGVPYTGATEDVDLGEFGLSTGYVQLDTTPTNVPNSDGVMSWNDADGTVDLQLKGGNVTLQVGQEEVVRVVNKTGGNLLESQYRVCRIRTKAEGGAQGQRLAVVLAQANTKANHSGILGIVTENIDNNQEGFITTFGKVRGVNTTGSLQSETWADGDEIYLSATVAGGLTNVQPVAHPVQIGYVVYAHANNGVIFVKVENGVDELADLHDVRSSAKTTPVDADAVLLQDSADSSLWKRLTWANLKGAVKTYLDTFKGVAGGYASLDGSGKVPASELPSYVDDVIEVANYAALPVTGETGKIYITLDDNKVYRWSGSVYVEIASGGGGTWGSITGTLSNQTDLQTALNGKQNSLTFDNTPTNGSTNPVTSDGVFDALALKQDTLTNPVTGTGASGQVSYWTGTNTQAGSNNLFWDAVNNRLALGTSTTTSATRLIIQGTTASDGGQLGSELLTTGTGDASWTGTDFATGYTHVTGSTTTLTSTLAAVVNSFYQITYTVTGRTAGTFTIAFGGVTLSGLTATGNVGPRATTTGTLVITPTSDFNGTIVLSIRVISASTPTVSFLSSAGTVTNEIRVSNTNTNTFVGLSAGSRNTTGGSNSFFGRDAGQSNTTGAGNSFVGLSAGSNNTTGSNNTFVGFQAGQSNTTGGNNSFFGLQAGSSNTTGGSNSFVGRSAGSSNTTGSSNSFFGLQAGSSNTTGGQNSFVGVSAGFSNTTGIQNSFVGVSAGSSNTTGGGNSFVGFQAGLNNTTGSSNSFIGIISGTGNTTGSNNTCVGRSSIGNNTTGSNNTALGRDAGRFITGGSTANTISNNSIFLGFETRANADNETNQVVIGYQTTGLGSNTTVLGNTSTTQTHLYGDLTLGTTTSGGRLTVRGSGTTSAANSLLVEDSAGTDTFVVRNDGGYAFKGGTVGLAQTGYTTFTNLTTDRTCDANATTVEELADILGTLIEDLKTKGIISA